MKHRTIWAAAIAVAMAAPAYANPHADRIIEQLKAEGYVSFETERTWLGRIRIEAGKDNLEREIVLNRSSGEILRDYTFIIEDALLDDEEDDEGGDRGGDAFVGLCDGGGGFICGEHGGRGDGDRGEGRDDDVCWAVHACSPCGGDGKGGASCFGRAVRGLADQRVTRRPTTTAKSVAPSMRAAAISMFVPIEPAISG